MVLDLLSGVMLILFTWLGFRSGAINQLIRLGALVLIFFVTPWVARLLAQGLYGKEALSDPILMWCMTALGGFLVYVVALIVGHLLFKPSKDTSRKDRLAGAGFGFLGATALVYLLTSSVLVLESDVQTFDPNDRLYLQQSRALQVSRHIHRVVPWMVIEKTVKDTLEKNPVKIPLP